MLIDSHAHLNFKAFDKDRGEVIKRSLSQDVWLINASSTYATSKLAVEIAEKYKQGIYASVGLHPIHVKDEEFDYEKYKSLALSSDKVAAIGETGLDYMYGERELQKQVFLEHLRLAQDVGLPVIFHCRKAHDDLLKILQRTTRPLLNPPPLLGRGRKGGGGVVHCFSGRWSQAKQYLEMGLYLGFNGIIFKLDLDEVIEKTPLDKMLVETDCPYLTPLPAIALQSRAKAGPTARAERNEPIFVKYVAERIAQVKDLSFEQVAEATTENAKKLFRIFY